MPDVATGGRRPVDACRRRWLLGAVRAATAGSLLAANLARAQQEPIEVRAIRLDPAVDGESFLLAVDLKIELPTRLIEAIDKGVPLVFLIEAELFEPRWYWVDDKVATSVQTCRLSYHALSRQYRLHVNGQQQSFGELAEAIAALGRIRDWRFVDADRIRYGTLYEGQLRVRLDPAQLPKPLQVTALTNKDWMLQTEWKRFQFKP